MDHGSACPRCGSTSPALAAVSEAVLAIASELSVERALRKIVNVARELVDAEYAALGIPDGRGGFAQFFTSGMTSEQWDAIGPLPRTHGMLGAMLEERGPYRDPDIQQDSRFEGWPEAHPDMHSFLGVPIVSRGEIIAAFYLTDKQGTHEFSEADQELIEVLAAHAAIAIENARLFERAREASVVQERNRLARELHDSVSQTLFSVALTAEAAGTLLDRDREQARAQISRVQELARAAVQEMRALVFELRSADIEADGLVPTLRKHVDVLRRVRHAGIEVEVDGERRLTPEFERELFRIAQEALNNALKHAQAESIRLRVQMNRSRVTLSVCDNGAGFDCSDARIRNKRLGLTSMQERAEAIGALLDVQSEPGAGTDVRVEVHLGE